MSRAGWRSRGAAILAVIGLALPWAARPALADRHCAQPAARLVSAFGAVEYRSAGEERWRTAALDLAVCPDDQLRTGAASRAAIVFRDTDTVLRIDQNTVLRVRGRPGTARSFIDLLIGTIQIFSRTPHGLEVDTPFVNAAVEGTEFVVRVGPDSAAITVFDGRVAASNRRGRASVTGGQSVVAGAGEAPRAETVIRPRDAVQWALYYPPVLSEPGGDDAGEAARLLMAGRVQEARARLARAPETAATLALQSVIAVALDRRDEALRLGRAAVARDPESGAPRIALSYAYQAALDLDAAQAQMSEAVRRQPRNALAWSRLAELRLAQGRLDDASGAAVTAAGLAPDSSHANTMLGFSALAEIDVAEAEAAFGRAIRLDSQDPLPRFGRGLAMIRRGALAAGRQEMEIAAALDPGRALIRSYLGKALSEEGRDPLAAKELGIAKALDPLDPTPHLYDAMRNLADNRPVDALDDLQRSIALNDNRAVYRSRQLLDEDAAMRGASLSRVYRALGFDQAALAESSASLALDPGNHSAHRFLSDSYAAQPRHEIARASELLQAQLLQPVNIDPVRPAAQETDLNILSGVGPAESAFNEFTPLFARDGVRLEGTGQIGNHRTLGDEAVLYGIGGPLSFSLGQFYHRSDGFRVNNDVRHEIYNAFAQVSVTPRLQLQTEFRRRESDQGDLRLDFDPDSFSTFDRRRTEQDTARIGARFAPRPGHDFIASAIYTERDLDTLQLSQGVIEDSRDRRDGYDLQGQYLFGSERLDVVAGGGFYDIDVAQRSVLDLSGTFPGGVCLLPGGCLVNVDSDSPIVQRNVYVYGHIRWPQTVTWTLGASYDDFRQTPVDVESVNPKLGVQWDVLRSLRLRAVYMRSVKRALIVDQTLEPTQVAGFNQFFDDFDGTEATRYGVGLDAKLTARLFAGLEATRRRLDVPVAIDNAAGAEAQDEQRHRGYLYWAMDRDWALSLEGLFESFENNDQADATLPSRVRTLSFPVTVRYFDASGFFALLGATPVHQRATLGPSDATPSQDETFTVFDGAVGFRFPGRAGYVSLEARNLFNESFRYQDHNIQGPEPSNPRFLPDRAIFARLKLRW